MSRFGRHILLLALALCGLTATAESKWSLDSIASWGRFPRMCIDVYRWGDRFFNSYDTAYVEGTGYKFSLKGRTEGWTDDYSFKLPNDIRLQMRSEPMVTAGLWLNYMALSVGYDVDLTTRFSSFTGSRQRLSIGFNCALFSVDAFMMNNSVGTRITRFGTGYRKLEKPIDFNAIDNSSWGINLCYYFNHKRYSQAAANSMSRVQRRSQGSAIAGIAISSQDYNFDFGTLPADMLPMLPAEWNDYRYSTSMRNYEFIIGYAYNWVPARHWCVGVWLTPHIGWRHGYTSATGSAGTSFALANRAMLSVGWTNKRWFASLVSSADSNLIYDSTYIFGSTYICGHLTVGYRFNLW